MSAEYKEVLCKSSPEIKSLKLEEGGSQFITNSQIKSQPTHSFGNWKNNSI